MGSLNIWLMNKLNGQLRILANKINTAKLHSINTHFRIFGPIISVGREDVFAKAF